MYLRIDSFITHGLININTLLTKKKQKNINRCYVIDNA